MSGMQAMLNRLGVTNRGGKQTTFTWNGKAISARALKSETASTPGFFAAAEAKKKRLLVGVKSAGVAKKVKVVNKTSILKLADGILGQAEEDEEGEVVSGFLRSFPGLPDDFKRDFENQIKQISSRQAWSGSWLEYTGMRFTEPGIAIVDQERTRIDKWSDRAFQAIINPAADLTVFLKSKFNLRELNNDPAIIEGSSPPVAWKDIDGKGKMDVEPDVIVAHRTGGRVHIYIVELKIGNGKKEQKAAEHHQLMRLRHRIEMMSVAAGQPTPVVHLYFCAWQHGTKETNVGAIDFRRSRLGEFPPGSKYHVTVINSAGFERITHIKSNFVNALLQKMDIVRLKLFSRTLKQFMSRKGRYYPQMVSYAAGLNAQLGALGNRATTVFAGPPMSVRGGASGSNQPAHREMSRVAFEFKFNEKAPKSFNNLSPESLAAEIAKTQNRLGRLQASSARRMSPQQVVETARAQSDELRRLEAARKATRLAPVNENMGINFNR